MLYVIGWIIRMKIIPVIDLKNGEVVLAKKGLRSQYAPLESKIVTSTKPIDVAKFFQINLKTRTTYIADLDSIMRNGESFSKIKDIAVKTGLELIVDTGASTMKEVEELFKYGVSVAIIGTETLKSIHELKRILERYPQRIAVSLDLENGVVKSSCDRLSKIIPEKAVSELVSLEVKKLIVLDIQRVGTLQGLDIQLINKIRKIFRFELIIGGGISNLRDLQNLKTLGVDGVLIATALHQKIIGLQDIINLNM